MQTKTCTECSATKPLTEFYARSKRQGGTHRQCAECMAYDRWVRRLLAASHPRPEACYICGRTDLRLEIEHDHVKAEVSDPRESYRGHACHPCNLKRRRVGGAVA